MGRILTLVRAGAMDLVRGFAAEGAGLRPRQAGATTSPLSRAVARLRADLREPGTMNPLSYEDARNVYRRAERAAAAGGRAMDRLRAGGATGGGGLPIPRPYSRPPPLNEYGVLVVTRTRAGTEYRVQVVITAPARTLPAEVIRRAIETVKSDGFESSSGTVGFKTGVPVVPESAILWIQTVLN